MLRVETRRTGFIAGGIAAGDAFALEHPAADRNELKRLALRARTIKRRHGTPRWPLRDLRALDPAR
ncbi:hypothetical protein ABU614_21290 [Lysobacter firmicutimachus]|uniref:Uncharacterized protein n=1 Tax=Lysobacter firmicutimachus TaxID=1792846 RepID=A0AAU8MT45_9GAMM